MVVLIWIVCVFAMLMIYSGFQNMADENKGKMNKVVSRVLFLASVFLVFPFGSSFLVDLHTYHYQPSILAQNTTATVIYVKPTGKKGSSEQLDMFVLLPEGEEMVVDGYDLDRKHQQLYKSSALSSMRVDVTYKVMDERLGYLGLFARKYIPVNIVENHVSIFNSRQADAAFYGFWQHGVFWFLFAIIVSLVIGTSTVWTSMLDTRRQ